MTLGRSLAAIIHSTLSTLSCSTTTLNGLGHEGGWITRSVLRFVPLNNPSSGTTKLYCHRKDKTRHACMSFGSKGKADYAMGATPDCSMICAFVHGHSATTITIGNTFVLE